MWFAWDGDDESSPRTVCHPCPHCMTSSHNTLVELDGSVQLAATCLHHAAGRLAFPPARATFEGDNLLVVPRYRCGFSASVPAAAPHMQGGSVPEACARRAGEICRARLVHAYPWMLASTPACRVCMWH